MFKVLCVMYMTNREKDMESFHVITQRETHVCVWVSFCLNSSPFSLSLSSRIFLFPLIITYTYPFKYEKRKKNSPPFLCVSPCKNKIKSRVLCNKKTEKEELQRRIEAEGIASIPWVRLVCDPAYIVGHITLVRLGLVE